MRRDGRQPIARLAGAPSRPSAPAPRTGTPAPRTGTDGGYPWVDGELLYAADLNAAFAKAYSGTIVATIAALRAATTATLPASLVTVRSYSGTASKGGGDFVYVSTDTTTADNGGTIIVDASNRRWYRELAQDSPYNITWFGCIGDGTTDNLAAFNSALAAASAGYASVTLYVPKGTYSFSAAVNYSFSATYTSLAITGDGAEESILLWPNGTNGISITYSSRYNSIHFDDLSFLGGGVNVGTAVSLTGAFTAPGPTEQNDIEHCTFRGSDGPSGTNCWASHIVMYEVSTINIDGCLFNGSASLQGTGFSCSGTAAQYSAIINLVECYFYNLATAVNYGNNTQAIILTSCTILNTTSGVIIASGLVNLDELQIIGCDISCVTACVSMLTPVPTFMVTGSFIQVPVSNSGLYLPVYNLLSITGNVFSGEPNGTSGQTAILAAQTVGLVGGVITGNAFYNLADYGVSLGVSTTNTVVRDNMYNAVRVPVLNQGTANTLDGDLTSFRNVLHNSLFNINQRGLGVYTTTGYTLDRWALSVTGDTVSVSQGTILDAQRTSIGDEAAAFSLGNTFTGTSGAGSFNCIYQPVEGVRRLSGKTVTVSFWANASGALKLGCTLYQYFGTGGSPSATVTLSGQAVTLSASYSRYSLTFNLPSTSGKTLGTNKNDATVLYFWFSSGTTNAANAGNIGVQSGSINIWGVQLEPGNVMSALEKPDPRYDLNNCQRFFQLGYIYSSSYQNAAGGVAAGAMTPTPMQHAPTVVVTNNGNSNISGFAASYSQGAVISSGTATASGGCSFNFTYSLSADL